MNSRILTILCLTLTVSACSKNEPAVPSPVGATTTTAGQAPTGQAAANSGKVYQVAQAGSYTYAEVEARPGLKAWMAGPHIELKPGDMVHWSGVAMMRNFTSQSLGRTFDEILFVSSWGPAGAAVVATPTHGSLPAPAAPGSAEAGASGVVKSVAAGGGYSYIEVDQGGTTVWVAAMETPMKAGDKVSWQGGSEMRNFTAKSIGRSFDRIIFASAVTVNR